MANTVSTSSCMQIGCLAKTKCRARVVLFITLLIAIPMTSHATEEPDYKVVQKFDAIEVREYGAYTVAEVVVPGPANEAGNKAFPILAGYIFGKNKGDRKLAMTAPVTQAAEGFVALTAPRQNWAEYFRRALCPGVLMLPAHRTVRRTTGPFLFRRSTGPYGSCASAQCPPKRLGPFEMS